MKILFQSFILLFLLSFTSICFGWATPCIISSGAVASGEGACLGGTTDYVGKSTGTAGQTIVSNTAYATLDTPNCPTSECSSGTIDIANIWHNTADSDTAKVCVYIDLGTPGTPDSSDTLVGCSDPIAASSQTTVSGPISGSVSCGSDYWVIIIPSTTNWTIGYATSSGNGYTLASFGYSSPPSDLTGSWSLVNRAYRAYAEIE